MRDRLLEYGIPLRSPGVHGADAWTVPSYVRSMGSSPLAQADFVQRMTITTWLGSSPLECPAISLTASTSPTPTKPCGLSIRIG